MKRAGLLLTLVAAVACGRGERGKGVDQAPPVAAPAPSAQETHGGEESVVRIAADMLRDLKLTTTAVERRPGGEGTAVLGELHVDESRYAEVSSPLAAEAVTILGQPGDRVRAGQGLALMASLEVGRARGALREAEARHRLALQTLERKRSLVRERIAPGREVQEAEAEFQTAEAALAAARATLSTLRVPAADEGGRFVLVAPIAGTVLERGVVRGQVVDAGRVLFRLGDLARLWVIAHAAERDAVRVRVGSAARVSLPAIPGESFRAEVAHVGSLVEAASRTIPVRLTLANPKGLLRPGMSATVSLAVGDGAALLAVPAAALQRLHDSWCVFVPREAGVFEVRRVGRGRDLGGEVEILTGLKEGETVVVEGAFLLKAEGEKAEGEGAHHDH